MEAILALATILGGITALWFLWEKIPRINVIATDNQWKNIKTKSFLIQPTKNRIVAKVEWSSPWVGGIKLPEAVRDPPNQGVVVAIGDEVKKIKVGQTVFWNKYSYQELKADDKHYIMVRENDVLGVIE